MKYFTPELYARGQSADPATQNEVEELWEREVDRYEEHLQQVRPRLPEHLREYLDELLLHDAVISSIAREGDKLHMTLSLDTPPRDVVFLTYDLFDKPVIERDLFAPAHQSAPAHYLYNEFDATQRDGQTVYTESILFSNGWELRLEYTDVHVTVAQPLYPLADGAGAPGPAATLPRSA